MPCDDSPFWLRFDGSNVTTAAGTGRWHFVHGAALDDPVIGLNRKPNGTTLELYFVTDGNGRQVAVGKGDGNFNPCDQGECSENLGWSHAGASSNSGTFDVSRMAAPGAPGLSFFRNRIYDQATGRWTQEDPIGVAGGVNLYQYAGNNPVMYSDPFGLFDIAYGDAGTKALVEALRKRSKTFDAAVARIENDRTVMVTVGRGSTIQCGGSGGCTTPTGLNSKGQQGIAVTWHPGGVLSDHNLEALAGGAADINMVVAHELAGHAAGGVSVTNGRLRLNCNQSCAIRIEQQVRSEYGAPPRTSPY